MILQQLYHVGQHGDADNSFHPNWSPSGLPSYHDSDGSHAMTEAEIEETIDGFVQSARRCHEAGFDGVEVWAAYHGIVDQFWTPWSNRRDDRWGSSLENRLRFSREIITRIRKLCGQDFIIGLSVSDEPDVSAALQRESLAEIVARVLPWKAPEKTIIRYRSGFPMWLWYLRAVFITPSIASAPELQKKTRSAKLCSHSRSAKRSCSGITYRLEVCHNWLA